MNTNDRDKLFEEKLTHLLDEGVEKLDNRTRQRLELIRRKALNGREERFKRFFIPLRWMTVGGFTAAATAAVAVFFWLHTSPGDLPARHVEDLEIITSKEHIDLFQNLDFYEWLAAKENGRTKGNAS